MQALPSCSCQRVFELFLGGVRVLGRSCGLRLRLFRQNWGLGNAMMLMARRSHGTGNVVCRLRRFQPKGLYEARWRAFPVDHQGRFSTCAASSQVPRIALNALEMPTRRRVMQEYVFGSMDANGQVRGRRWRRRREGGDGAGSCCELSVRGVRKAVEGESAQRSRSSSSEKKMKVMGGTTKREDIGALRCPRDVVDP